jgi:hypothetical protein
MSLTYEEVCEHLVKLDEITLLEVLDISSEDLVERFRDVIEEKLEKLKNDVEEEFSDPDE